MLDILQYSFIQNALLAGICVAVVAAVAGYFMIVRGLTFAGHALPNIGFAGAAGGALPGGWAPRLRVGFFILCAIRLCFSWRPVQTPGRRVLRVIFPCSFRP